MGSAHRGGKIHGDGICQAPETDALKSCQYTHALRSFFNRGNLSVSLRLGQPPDDDIVLSMLSIVIIYCRSTGRAEVYYTGHGSTISDLSSRLIYDRHIRYYRSGTIQWCFS